MLSAGGLVTAVAPVVIECGGLWVGWTGLTDFKTEDSIPESKPDDQSPTAGILNPLACKPIQFVPEIRELQISIES